MRVHLCFQPDHRAEGRAIREKQHAALCRKSCSQIPMTEIPPKSDIEMIDNTNQSILASANFIVISFFVLMIKSFLHCCQCFHEKLSEARLYCCKDWRTDSSLYGTQPLLQKKLCLCTQARCTHALVPTNTHSFVMGTKLTLCVPRTSFCRYVLMPIEQDDARLC